jgi:hypothetical protein
VDSNLIHFIVKMCDEVNVSEYNSIDLCHLRLDYISEKGIGIHSKKNYVPSYDTSLTSYIHYLAENNIV